MRRTWLAVTWWVLTALAQTSLAGGPAAGAILVTDKKLNPAARSFQDDMKTEARTTLVKPADSETWTLHFIAHLKKAAGAEELHVVFYEKLDPKAPKVAKPAGPPEPVNAYPIHTKADAKMVMSELPLKPEDGFKSGGKYEVRVTRLINGKEEIYAKTNLELK